MTAPVNEKAGWCSMCRSEMHSMCASDSCTCPDKRRHRARPGFAGRAATVTPIAQNRKTPAAPAEEAAVAAAPKKPAPEPIIELVEETPPPARAEADRRRPGPRDRSAARVPGRHLVPGRDHAHDPVGRGSRHTPIEASGVAADEAGMAAVRPQGVRAGPAVKRLAAAAALAVTVAGCSNRPRVVEFTTVPRPHPAPRPPEAADPTGGLAEVLDVAAARASRPRASRSRQRAVTAAASRAASPPAAGDTRTVTSTAYCLTGAMANGQRARVGAVAMNGVPLGSVWEVEGGGTYVVADRVERGSEFDIAMPGDCAAARAYGRRTVTVRRVG